MLPYERFEAWQKCHALVLRVYQATASFPATERYGLRAQARQAAFSAAANIAEGSARRGPREFRRFLDLSLGSLSELAYTLRLAFDLGMLSEAEWRDLDSLRDNAGKLTWGLYDSVRRCAKRS
jgi:four helix bundle protein